MSSIVNLFIYLIFIHSFIYYFIYLFILLLFFLFFFIFFIIIFFFFFGGGGQIQMFMFTVDMVSIYFSNHSV